MCDRSLAAAIHSCQACAARNAKAQVYRTDSPTVEKLHMCAHTVPGQRSQTTMLAAL